SSHATQDQTVISPSRLESCSISTGANPSSFLSPSSLEPLLSFLPPSEHAANSKEKINKKARILNFFFISFPPLNFESIRSDSLRYSFLTTPLIFLIIYAQK